MKEFNDVSEFFSSKLAANCKADVFEDNNADVVVRLVLQETISPAERLPNKGNPYVAAMNRMANNILMGELVQNKIQELQDKIEAKEEELRQVKAHNEELSKYKIYFNMHRMAITPISEQERKR